MTRQELREIRLQNLAAYMADDLEEDRQVIEMVFAAAYDYLTHGVTPDPMLTDPMPDELSLGLFDLALNSLALHWRDHRDDMESGAFPEALRPMLTQLKARGGGLVG